MPRKTADQIVADARVRAATPHLRPREGCPEAVRQVFLDIVTACAPDHFRAADAGLIEQYAQATLLARQAYANLESEGPVVAGKANAWLVVLEKAHRSAAVLATRLRLTPQSRIDPKTAGRAQSRPLSFYEWESIDADRN